MNAEGYVDKRVVISNLMSLLYTLGSERGLLIPDINAPFLNINERIL